jgi:hypothetical protein
MAQLYHQDVVQDEVEKGRGPTIKVRYQAPSVMDLW